MNNVTFNIDSTQVHRFTQKLREVHRKHLPSACRSTLNDTALYVKTVSLNEQFNRRFNVKNKTFLKAHSWADKAQGWNISAMKSYVGIVPKIGGNSDKSSEAAQGLTMQEFGGGKEKRSMYNKEARRGKTRLDLVNSGYYLKKIKETKGIIHTRFKHRGTKKSRFVAAAIMAIKLGKIMKIDKQLFYVRGLMQNIKTRKIKIKMTNFANVDSSRKIEINKRAFLLPASEKAQKLMGEFFIKNAEFQLKKAKI